MKITISLTEIDFLINLLYLVTSKEEFKKNNLRNRLLFPGFFLIFALIFFLYDKTKLFQAMLILSFTWAALFPLYKGWFMKKYYKAYIAKHYQGSFNVPTVYTIAKDVLKIKNQHVNSTVPFSDIEKIIEIKTHFFVVLKDESTLIFPKILAKEQLNLGFIDKLSEKSKIAIEHNLSWKW